MRRVPPVPMRLWDEIVVLRPSLPWAGGGESPPGAATLLVPLDDAE